MTEVLIAGAGPVGLTLALELVRYGLEVRIIDRASHPAETSRALVLWSRTLELLDRAGPTQAYMDAGLKCRGGSMRNGGKILGRPSFEDIESAYNFALMIPQYQTERLLNQQLEDHGVTVERQVELVSFTDNHGEIDAKLLHADGREETVHPVWLLGCDGAHSAVRHGLGFEFSGSAQGDDWAIADIRIEGPNAPPSDELSIYLHHDGPFVVFPIPGGRARIIAAIGASDPQHERLPPTLEEVQAFADQRCGPGVRLVDPVWLTNFRINERKVANYSRGRVFLAGDAAHIHSPAGGQGMNTGMQDAFNLAWKLAMVHRGQAHPSLLDSYSGERSAVGEMVLRNATRLTDMATLSNPAAQAARNYAMHLMLGLHAVRQKLASTMSEIDIAYPKSTLSKGSGSGSRWLPDNYAGSAPGAGAVPRFVLYSSDLERGAELTAKYPELLEAVPRAMPQGTGLIIVRPDGYVGLSEKTGAWNEAENYVQSLQNGRAG
ncbi:FAD-binding monooxygenase [Aureimonas fodinaquatilis]|uniref:FAD-binding monooxygenase n=1 Tax=Aureimonas fodinaquatilis TaxID=2565783 RepID=A0A5B0DYA8_9HYPH|nr:FAD-dependent monooxygenase [Aureimonas fodinaquatilis]KAA0970992.1 FAD-binding monooxygenase [Aureimonas fodinaquatilis]